MRGFSGSGSASTSARFLVLFLIIYWLTDYYQRVGAGSDAFLLATISALLFFLSILLHELGHAVVAIRNGIPILGIDLWLFGGVAKLGRDTDSPGVEFRVAVAGPLVTLAIAAACFGLGVLISSPDEVINGAVYDESVSSQATAVLGYLMSINVIVLLFNLIPGFPLDGGRSPGRSPGRSRATGTRRPASPPCSAGASGG